MTRKVSIALDVMGGDSGPDAVVPAAFAVLDRDESVSLSLVGLPETLEKARRSAGERYGDRLRYVIATEVVEMHEHPAEVLRRKKKSSLRLAIQEVKDGMADACVSSGNTGALTATARYILKTLPGIDRPAIISAVPGLNGPSFMLDLGANVGCSPQHLLQFALMGSVVAEGILDIERASVGLLNIGEEGIKGNEVVREAGELLARSTLNYIGFVEGNDIVGGKANVIVSDGFVGNVALKTMEGVASLIASYLREEFYKNPLRKIQGLAAAPALNALRNRLDARRYNGASLVGLNGVVIKSHGDADKLAFQTAVHTAIVEARKGVPVQIGKLVEDQSAVCIRA
jgi:glycerol-3-phosphate acyltransferase PlsX